MNSIRFAYATQYLIAVIAIYALWSQVGGQSHLDLLPWWIKLALGAGAAFAVVKATAAAVSHEHPWNGGTLKWMGFLLALLVACGLATYYAHMNLESDDNSDEGDTTSVGSVSGGHRAGGQSTTFSPVRQERYTASTNSNDR